MVMRASALLGGAFPAFFLGLASSSSEDSSPDASPSSDPDSSSLALPFLPLAAAGFFLADLPVASSELSSSEASSEPDASSEPEPDSASEPEPDSSSETSDLRSSDSSSDSD